MGGLGGARVVPGSLQARKSEKFRFWVQRGRWRGACRMQSAGCPQPLEPCCLGAVDEDARGYVDLDVFVKGAGVRQSKGSPPYDVSAGASERLGLAVTPAACKVRRRDPDNLNTVSFSTSRIAPIVTVVP